MSFDPPCRADGIFDREYIPPPREVANARTLAMVLLSGVMKGREPAYRKRIKRSPPPLLPHSPKPPSSAVVGLLRLMKRIFVNLAPGGRHRLPRYVAGHEVLLEGGHDREQKGEDGDRTRRSPRGAGRVSDRARFASRHPPPHLLCRRPQHVVGCLLVISSRGQPKRSSARSCAPGREGVLEFNSERFSGMKTTTSALANTLSVAPPVFRYLATATALAIRSGVSSFIPVAFFVGCCVVGFSVGSAALATMMDVLDKEADGKGTRGPNGETLGGSEEGKSLLEKLEGRRVKVTGVFDHSKEVLVGESSQPGSPFAPAKQAVMRLSSRGGGTSEGAWSLFLEFLVGGLLMAWRQKNDT